MIIEAPLSAGIAPCPECSDWNTNDGTGENGESDAPLVALSDYRCLPTFPILQFLCNFVRRRRERMLVCYPHYRPLQYICDQPGIRVGFFVSSYFYFPSAIGQTAWFELMVACFELRAHKAGCPNLITDRVSAARFTTEQNPWSPDAR